MAKGNNINIGVGADISGLKSGMEQAAQTVQAAGSKMESAAKDATAKTETAFKSLQQAYRTTAKDAQQIAMAQGLSSQAFIEASQKAAEFKDQLDDVNDVINAFHPEKRFKIAGDAISGVAGALQGLYGGMELLGVNTQETQKVISTLMSLQGLAGMGAAIEQASGAFKAMGVMINTTVIPSLMTLQGALIATGIGAVVVAVIALTQAASNYNDQLDREIDLKKQIAEQDKLMQQAVDKAKNAQLRTEELKVRAMKEGTAKQLAELDLRKRMEIQAEKETFEASNKTYFDSSRLAERTKYITNYYVNQAREIQSKVSTESQKTGGIVAAMLGSTNEIKGKQGIMKGNLLGDLPEQLKVAQVGIENFVTSADAQASNFATKWTESMDKVKEALTSVGLDAFGQLGTALGQSMAGVDVSLEQILGNIANTLGSAMMAISAPLLAVPGTQALGFAYAGAGFALKAIGSYLNATGGKSIPNSSGSGGGGYSPSNGYSGFTPNDNQFSINSRLIGTDLLLSVQKSNKRMERIR